MPDRDDASFVALDGLLLARDPLVVEALKRDAISPDTLLLPDRRVPVRVDTGAIGVDPPLRRWEIDPLIETLTPRQLKKFKALELALPWDFEPSPGSRRGELTVPVAPTGTPGDGDLFESPDRAKRYALPRYALAFDRVGAVEEPRIAIADRQGTPNLVLTLVRTPSPAAGPGVMDLPHKLAVTLKYSVPVIGGGKIVQELPFPLVLVDDERTMATAELPLTTPGLRAQLLAALASLDASVTLVAARVASVAVPTGRTFADGAPGYSVQPLVLDWVVPPTPLVLSDAQRARLGGGGVGGVQPMARIRVQFGDRRHSYWQDPARPERYYFLPDRFLLARAPTGARKPLLRVSAAGGASEADVRVTLEFQAQPVMDLARLQAARPTLEAEARARGSTAGLALEIMPEAQPLLRLALPQSGAPSATLTERAGTQIDLERGLVHAETFSLEDFRLVYEALFGASLSLLRGEVRVRAGGGEPEDIPLELRMDRTDGPLLSLAIGQAGPDRVSARLSNPIESPVSIARLGALAVAGDKRTPLRVEGLAPGQRLASGEARDLELLPDEALADGALQAVIVDESDVTVEPDSRAIWALVFDRHAEAQLKLAVTVEAFAELFVSPDRPGDRVVAFVVVVEHGGTVRVTEAQLVAGTTVRVPVEPLLTGGTVPPIRYRTETWWQSGGIGESPWRETDATILLPVKTAPPRD